MGPALPGWASSAPSQAPARTYKWARAVSAAYLSLANDKSPAPARSTQLTALPGHAIGVSSRRDECVMIATPVFVVPPRNAKVRDERSEENHSGNIREVRSHAA